MKYILLIFALFTFSGFCYGQDKEEPFYWGNHGREIPPSFPGGEAEMHRFIESKFYYPPSALKDSIQGRVAVRFRVRKTGDIDSVRVIRGIHPDCDKVAMDIVKAMPKWISGSQMDKKVDVWFTLPIIFRLKD